MPSRSFVNSALGAYRPIGQADSERAFCAFMARLQMLWTSSDPPPCQERLSVLSGLVADLWALQRHGDECAPGVQPPSGISITSTGQTAIRFASVPGSDAAWN